MPGSGEPLQPPCNLRAISVPQAPPMSEAEHQSMSRYLAEVYVAHLDEFTAVMSPVRAAARGLSREGTPVRHVRSIFVPEDQTGLLLFEAGSPAAVQQVTRRAGLHVTRVVAALESSGPGRQVRNESNVESEEIEVGQPGGTTERREASSRVVATEERIASQLEPREGSRHFSIEPRRE
jgi:hypothetical protein